MSLRRWTFLLVVLAGEVGLGAGVRAQSPAATATPDVPKGEVTRHVFDQSRIFPGTVRDYWIYIPRQYDPARPACVYIDQDNVQFNAPAVFDQLIASKEMPVTIGIFVAPGRVKALAPGALDRFNRSYEYDSLGDNYARFLLEELLPQVEKQTASDGRPIHLSHDGNDRCIAGSSSGAICAFTAAWERPGDFSRVFSSIGTYVGLRGGNEYPTLIRKTEPKPLRVFLQDGSTDLNNYGGNWFLAAQEMESALTFSGYEVNHVWGTGGHNPKQATEIFPDAMRWLWKDWPNPVKPGLGSPQLQEVLLPTEPWRAATASPPNETEKFPPSGRLYRLSPDSPDAAPRVWLVKSSGEKTALDTGIAHPGGVALSPDQSLLYIDDSRSHWVYSYEIQPDGLLTDKQAYYHLHQPDMADDSGAAGMCVDQDGRLYVATCLGVQVCDQAGRVNCILPVPGGPVAAIHFDSANPSLLVATSGGKTFQRLLKTRGVLPSDAPHTPAAPRL